MAKKDYKRDMRIDESNLALEWLDQAELATDWNMEYVEAEDELTRADENVKFTRSELILKINQDPDEYLGKGVKATDPKVEAAYRTHRDYLAAKERWMDAKKELSELEHIKKEIGFTRKAALENLVTLHGQNYFAGPKIPFDLTKERFSKITPEDRGKMGGKAFKRKRKKPQ